MSFKENRDSFPCTICGACCKNIKGIAELASFDLGNGICKYLDKQSNCCRIYANRPEICRVDVIYEKRYAGHYTKEAFYQLNIESCRFLQEKENVAQNLRL
ncbi:YkgJ family cysteine cluster protein [Helicobacter sp. MIT 14-3879]|uniref:YkgJ family cysteine cluster protein n=1 Tax=Helicobacter sp. MIT 14-3879 TaxID=2040649 RepID=UPI000E1EFF3B|nr:YkgJ family cysteine cluster protein [Helicobacter sp. MIT 14-3879]RDU59867.1 YkgJ family cysteine cluster protein [Helicobacter sp. MIT 14-3879]